MAPYSLPDIIQVFAKPRDPKLIWKDVIYSFGVLVFPPQHADAFGLAAAVKILALWRL